MISPIFKLRIDLTKDKKVLFLEGEIIIRLIQDGYQRGEYDQVHENIEKLEYILNKLSILQSN